MHITSRYRALGFVDSDSTGIRAYNDMTRRSGWTLVQRARMIIEFARVNHRFPSMTYVQQMDWFLSVAHTLRLTDDQCALALQWHEQVNLRGFRSMFSPAPSAADLKNEHAEIRQIMRDDPDRYLRDENLQLRLTEILELLESGDVSNAPATAASKPNSIGQRLDEIRALMGDPSSEYWRGPNAATLQNEYRSLISPTANSPQIRSGAASARINVLRQMIGDEHSEYWRGTSAANLQGEYRELVSSDAPAALPAPTQLP